MMAAVADMRDLGAVYIEALTVGRCPSGKLRFADGAAAGQALELARLRREREPQRLEQRIYTCDLCRGLHLTARPAP